MVILQYVATLREQLEQLATEQTPEGLPRHGFFNFLFNSPLRVCL